MKPHKLGIVFGALIGGWHALWVLLVISGAAQPVLNFLFWAHMIRPPYIVTGFALLPAVVLLIVTSVTGYLFGYIGGIIWTKLHRGLTNENLHPLPQRRAASAH